MLKYLPTDERALYNARQILMSNSYGVDNAISKVPEHLKNDPGLEFDRLRWRNRRGRLEGSLEILYKNSNKTERQMIRPDLWWEQRKSVARSLIYKKRYKTAYKILVSILYHLAGICRSGMVIRLDCTIFFKLSRVCDQSL